MMDRDSGTSCPSMCQIASSKTVCAKRLSGWTILCIMVVIFVYGFAMVINSRNQHHSEEVYEIDTAITIWNEQYQADTETWQPTLGNSNGDQLQMDELNTPDYTSKFSDLDKYEVVKYFTSGLKEFVQNNDENVVMSGTDGAFNITTDLLITFGSGHNLALEGVPLYTKRKSSRSKKD